MSILQFLKPLNLEEEQEKFFTSKTYNPTFVYNWGQEAVDTWLSHSTQKKYIPLVDAIFTQDHEQIVREAKKIFSTDVTPELNNKALDIVSQKRVKLKNQSIDRLVGSYEKVFQFFDIDYQIILSDEQGFAARPSHSKKTLTINRQLNPTYDSYEGLTRHEVLHIIRAINSDYNGIEKSDLYLPTEEGLACYVQDCIGTEENYSLFHHAIRYLVTKVALEGSFRDVVEYLREMGFEQSLAFRRAYRHKSGFVDTSKPGSIMKPSMYFYNLQRIQQLPKDEILRLMVGKISVEDLPQYPHYIGKISEQKLREYFEI